VSGQFQFQFQGHGQVVPQGSLVLVIQLLLQVPHRALKHEVKGSVLSRNDSIGSGWNGPPARSRRQLAAEFRRGLSTNQTVVTPRTQRSGPVARSTSLSTELFRLRGVDKIGAFALNPSTKAVLKPPHSKRWRDGLAPTNFAKRLECGAFTAAFSLERSGVEHQQLNLPGATGIKGS
jgi:hypothetical protein